ncbi:site-specific integrase [Defluviimonas sp. D31]|uniref:tyrosine-type recombinase/integrase n=1 Tax=Defluviimonas sp. D31 TaxID=3083253 RepID=UPI00296EA18B|nr:site-specific integrase [Defluviimonas sp. D31]MDW4550859.1 site-specific integrase [Defluviimonas sp. D31]
MGLTIFRRGGKGNWILRGTVAGARIYESTGTDQRRLADAKRIRRETELLERATLGRKATVTFAEAALAYLETGGEGRYLSRILEHFGPAKLLAEVDAEAVNAAARALYPEAAPATITRQLITPISAVVNMAAEDGLCAPRRFRRRGTGLARLDWITPEEAERLIAEIRAHVPHILRPVAILLGGGARTGEALTLERGDLYEATGEAFLAKTKNGEARMIRFPGRALAMILEGGLPEAGRICRTPKGRAYVVTGAHGGQIKGALERAVAAAGLDPRRVTPHVLRHTWATWYYAATRDFGALMDLGGWKSAVMANRYRKIAPEDLGARLVAHGWHFDRAEFRQPAPAVVVPFRRAAR